MNFDQAIVAHASWKRRLKSYLAHPDGSLKQAEIEVDNACELGKWIDGEGQRFAYLPEFVTLQISHARFHKAAGELVRRADAGEHVDEELAEEAKNEICDAASSVIFAITAMRSKV